MLEGPQQRGCDRGEIWVSGSFPPQGGTGRCGICPGVVDRPHRAPPWPGLGAAEPCLSLLVLPPTMPTPCGYRALPCPCFSGWSGGAARAGGTAGQAQQPPAEHPGPNGEWGQPRQRGWERASTAPVLRGTQCPAPANALQAWGQSGTGGSGRVWCHCPQPRAVLLQQG